MNKKIILLISGLVLILIIIFYQINSKNQEIDLDLFEVTRGDISEEISEVGQLKKGEEINLAFKSSGIIQKIYVKVGDKINKGDILAKIDTQGLNIQLEQSKSDMKIYQATLDKLLIGASPEEIRKVEIIVSNAQISLESAQQNLIDVKTKSEEDLSATHEDALNVLNDSYLKIYNAFLIVDSFQKEYFYYQDEESIKVKTNRNAIENAILEVRFFLNLLKDDKSYKNIDVAISGVKNSLVTTFESISFIREISEESIHRHIILDADKVLLDIERTSINTALINVSNSEQTISSTRLTNELNTNAAQTRVSAAEGSLATAENELAFITASPQKTDIDLYQAQVAKAKSQVKYLENQVQESYLYAPVNGQIAEIRKKTAEMALSGEKMILLLPADPFQIEVNIYEEDVVKVNIDNPVEISLVPFPNEIFKGKVISINPAEELIDGVVYYQVKISLEDSPDGVKSGMTADIVIQTDSRENVLIIPEDAIEKKDDQIIVEALKNGNIEEKEIEIGLEGTDNGMVEVFSGLLEGEKVILR